MDLLIDLRTHIFSLISIFLALAVGILIGSAMLGDGTLQGKQDELIRRLEAQFEQMRMSDRGAQAMIDKLQEDMKQLQFQNQVLSRRLIAGRLSGKRIMLIQVGSGEPLTGLLEAFRESGAHLYGTWTLQIPSAQMAWSGGANDESEAEGPLWWASWREFVIQQLSQANNVDPLEMARDLQVAVNEGWVIWQTDRLVEAGGVPSTAPTPIDIVIFVARQSGSDYYPLLGELLQQIRWREVQLAAVESSNLSPSTIPFWKSWEMITLDDIETRLGQAALIIALAEELNGAFGQKATAEALFPDE